MRRRAFLVRIGGTLAAASAPAAWLGGCALRPATTAGGPAGGAWRTLAAVQAHLFPSEADAPGAREIRAAGYLRLALDAPGMDPDERAFVLRGAAAVGRLARAHGGGFAALAHEEREAVLRAFEETDEGARWLAQILGYLMEALLGDPVYGGNPGGIGWRWLEHTPGFPRPPADRRYFLL